MAARARSVTRRGAITLLVVGLAAIGAWFFPRDKTSDVAVRPPPAGEWQLLSGCQYKPDRWNDGDSFHVIHRGEEYIFRLYFVDTSEAEKSMKERTATQAEYFGIDAGKAIALGKQASAFTEARLSRQPFSVLTRWRDALGRSKLKRSYAMIEVNGRDLGEELVENGLARIYGMKTALPDGSISTSYVNRLQGLEQHAKDSRRGGWGM